ncbi:DNA mismatch repair protein MutT, partial [Candidatus Peregrinibacteria bacterium CG10_big_fil_rev_8_21_14_0_10_42_8]
MTLRHFTATAFIVDSQKRTLLLWHKRLQRWMPPGGHIDPNETPEETAARECKEETGLDVEIVGDAQSDLFTENTHEGRMLKKP